MRLDLLADRLTGALKAPSRDAREHLLKHQPRERVAVSEVLIGQERHLLAAVSATHTWTLHDHTAPAERYLARLMAVAHRGAVPIVLALRADDLAYLLLHQLGHHAEPDAHAQREQPLLCCVDELAKRLLHSSRQRELRGRGLRDRYGLLHGGSSFDLWRIAAHAPNQSGRGRRDRRQVLRATGQPRCASCCRPSRPGEGSRRFSGPSSRQEPLRPAVDGSTPPFRIASAARRRASRPIGSISASSSRSRRPAGFAGRPGAPVLARLVLFEPRLGRRTGSVSYYNSLVDIHPSARKHRIAGADIEHATTYAMTIEDQDDDTRLYLGAARDATLLEVVTIVRDDGSELAIHAMAMRPKYQRLLPGD